MARLADSRFLNVPPAPIDAVELLRVDHTRLRRRLIAGAAAWEDDAKARLRTLMGATRARKIGVPDQVANPFEAMCRAAACLYDREPIIRHPDAEAAAAMTGLLRRASWFSLAQTVQRDVIALREMLIRVAVSLDENGDPRVVLHPVPPDLVTATADPDDPSQPKEIREWVLREHPASGVKSWTRSVWTADGGHTILDPSGDVTESYGAERAPADVLPWVVFHAAETGKLFDPFYGGEAVIGTLDIACLWAYHSHVLRNAAHTVKWTLGAEVASTRADADGTVVADADPAVVLALQPTPEFTGQAQVGQWAAGADPLTMAESIVMRERRLVAYAGIDPSEVHRTSGDPRSGVAIAISREGKRDAQRRFGPVFRAADERLVRLVAILVNGALGEDAFPVDGWTVEHQGIPPTIEEREADREQTLALVDARILTRAEARARILGETLEQARTAIAAMDAATDATPEPSTP